MACEHELRGHLVELHQLARHDRIVLAVDRAGLQRCVKLRIGDRRGIGAERFAEELPEFTRRHAEIDAGHVGRRLDLLVRLEVDAARAEIDRRDDLDAELILRRLYEVFADVALEHLLYVLGVAEQECRGHQRPGRNLLGDVGRREIAEFKIVTLQRDQLGTLLEQRVAPVRLEIEVVFDRARELLVGLRAKVRFGEGAAEA